MNTTEKTRRLLYLPLAYHAAVLLAAALSILNKNQSSMALLILLDLAGVLVSPMFMALLSIAHAVLHDANVYDYLKIGSVYLGVIGVLRVLLYLWLGGSSVKFALICSVASVIIFYLWDVIFAFTDKMMKKRRRK